MLKEIMTGTYQNFCVLRAMFLTAGYLWNVMMKTTMETTKVSEGEAHRALLRGFFTITFSPVLLVLCVFDVFLYILTNYVIPIVGIIFLLFVGFPMLKFLQWIYLTLLFVLNVVREYRRKWLFALKYAMGINDGNKEKEVKLIAFGDVLLPEDASQESLSQSEQMYYGRN